MSSASAFQSGLTRPPGIIGGITHQTDGGILGWAVEFPTWWNRIAIELLCNGKVIAVAKADALNQTLFANRIGDGNHGFALRYTTEQRQAIFANGGVATLRAVGARGQRELGAVKLERPQLKKNDDWIVKVRPHYLEFAKDWAKALAADTVSPKNHAPHPTPLYNRLFEPPPNQPSTVVQTSNVLEQTRLRHNLEKRFRDKDDAAESDNFLNWYVFEYSRTKGKLRLPLSKSQLDYLNAPAIVDGQAIAFSRAMWTAFTNVPGSRPTLHLEDENWRHTQYFVWAKELTILMNAEDCLVPDFVVQELSAVDNRWKGFDLPLSYFMEHHFHSRPELKFIDLNVVNGRLVYCALFLLECITRPDYLRFIPAANFAFLTTESNGGSPISRALNFILGESRKFKVSHEKLASVMSLRGFDIAAKTFTSLTSHGHRLESAKLQRPDNTELYDIQIIGAFKKASGLGQATRLSAKVLSAAGFKVNCVDSDLDNPSPEGFSSVGTLSHHQKAKINLLHMNADAIPAVFAYEPDVFSGAYNIGYFFWELDSPAECHFHAFDFLDEIWVSTEYGVEIYGNAFQGPVTNVGLTVETLPNFDKASGRKLVNEKFGFKDTEFVFFTTFDSFSSIHRKNPVCVLEAFKSAFPDDRDVRLVIKTQNRDRTSGGQESKIWTEIENLIVADDRITVINETLQFTDLLKIKSGCDCYVSLHRSEGWGFGMIEAMSLKVPVVCTAYSGNLEFCKSDTSWLVDYDLVELAKGEYVFVKSGQKWANPRVESAAQALKQVRDNAGERAARVERAFACVSNEFGVDAISKRYAKRIYEILEQCSMKTRLDGV